ncbi:hypothetical protein O6H91_02G130000 [Diphasiastrum complanatum]|uniref:Uncharacterized protein n=1 Tax=Diphasiastrum complanatum TaxID=34168 RepID=A0ACC2EKY4_DIPCM|nr:hypothetical protein O6H91_02G130000 [Diphasiastrum complanatum]
MIQGYRTLQKAMNDTPLRLYSVIPQAFKHIVTAVVLPCVEKLHSIIKRRALLICHCIILLLIPAPAEADAILYEALGRMMQQQQRWLRKRRAMVGFRGVIITATQSSSSSCTRQRQRQGQARMVMMMDE